MSVDIRNWFKDNVITLDFIDMIAGDKIAYGMSRHVYMNKLDPTTVIKFELRDDSFQNVMEWKIWHRVKDNKKLAPWFAPCVFLSPSANILIQKRTTPVPIERMPKKVPGVFADLKIQNWGRLDKRIVCHDYGTTLVFEDGLFKRDKKATWWSEG